MPAPNAPGRHRGQDLNPALPRPCHMGKFKWERQLGKMPYPAIVKHVGFALARHANRDGTSVHPGVYRLMFECGINDVRTVTKALKQLREDGLIFLTKPGGSRSKRADEYVLSTHERVAVWIRDYDTWRKERGLLPAEGDQDIKDDPWAF